MKCKGSKGFKKPFKSKCIIYNFYFYYRVFSSTVNKHLQEQLHLEAISTIYKPVNLD